MRGSGGMADAHASGACEYISRGFNSHLPHFEQIILDDLLFFMCFFCLNKEKSLS